MLTKLFSVFSKKKVDPEVELKVVEVPKEDIFKLDLSDKSKIIENAAKVKLKYSTYEKYKKTVKGCENLTYKQAKRKLYRNLLLSYKHENKEGNNKTLYSYGNMTILVVDNEIVHIRNYTRVPAGWDKDLDAYHTLNKILGIAEY